MFALEVWPGNEPTRRYFDITLEYVNQKGDEMNITSIPTEACTGEHWHFMPSLL